MAWYVCPACAVVGVNAKAISAGFPSVVVVVKFGMSCETEELTVCVSSGAVNRTVSRNVKPGKTSSVSSSGTSLARGGTFVERDTSKQNCCPSR
jgi:hypothetical protein